MSELITYQKKADKIRLVREASTVSRVKVVNSRDVSEFMRDLWNSEMEIKEHFWLLCLNNANIISGWHLVSIGSITGTLVDMRIIARLAIETGCVGVIMVHNHPSGSMKPSQADRDITKKCVNALKLFDIKVIDHVIIDHNGQHFSFADNGLID